MKKIIAFLLFVFVTVAQAAVICHVKEHPTTATLATIRFYDTTAEPELPSGWVRRTPEAQRTWEATEIAGGWTPTPVTPSPDQQQVEAEEAADLALLSQLAAVCDDMINGTGTQAERQRRVELWLGRLAKRLLKKGLVP